jgi:ADP-ribose pyrophosphatase YjhB (NUDIX family)
VRVAMPTPEFIVALRAKVGNDLLLVPTVAVLAHDEHGRLLLVRDNGSGLWGSPGGIVEPGELPADAAVRETWEESGVFVALTRVAGVFGGKRCLRTYANGNRIGWVATVFAARVVSGKPRGDGAETMDARLFSNEEIAGLRLKDSTRQFLAGSAAAESVAYFESSTWKPA